MLAWFSAENFSTSLIRAGLIASAAFGRGRISLDGATCVLGTFIGTHVAVFVALITATVGAPAIFSKPFTSISIPVPSGDREYATRPGTHWVAPGRSATLQH